MFVERQTYRKRRMQDAARFLPVIGLVLFLLPLFWPRGPEDGIAMSVAIEYIFAVWIALVAGALVLSFLIKEEPALEDGGAPEPPRGRND
ncbi:hypothetical protein PGB28_01880 [Primorskyibacter aestuariivivens]|uniref:hypothetical protein n=1 Tax=Primorskyibacter aestuariivivens TaxID=1888912 RepID=UPI0023008CE4|nr:hypothetical protein [Primorskyibacter aestuariivivens]MDA7427191.1 hypothetical protein [Primorskyibacter aestuariivivens]